MIEKLEILETVGKWNWGDNFFLPLLLLLVTLLASINWKVINKSYSNFIKRIKSSRREASFDTFKKSIDENFKSPCELDKIKIIKRLREKKSKAATDKGFNKKYFEKLIKKAYSDPRFVNKRLRRKIYKAYSKEKEEKEKDCIRFLNGEMTEDENVSFLKKQGKIK